MILPKKFYVHGQFEITGQFHHSISTRRPRNHFNFNYSASKKIINDTKYNDFFLYTKVQWNAVIIKQVNFQVEGKTKLAKVPEDETAGEDGEGEETSSTDGKEKTAVDVGSAGKGGEKAGNLITTKAEVSPTVNANNKKKDSIEGKVR